MLYFALCSRNFQNVKLRLVDFTTTPILGEIKIWRIQTVKIVIFDNFRHSELWSLVNFWLKSCSYWLKSKFRTSKIAKMTFLDCLKMPKFDFTQNRSDSKIIKYYQSQTLTSHFESFWSIVHWDKNCCFDYSMPYLKIWQYKWKQK